MKIYTIGFTKKTARQFFELLKKNGIECLVDIRLHPDGQLSGFSKREDLSFFLQELTACGYCHMPELAPTDEILRTYRTNHDWNAYLQAFEDLMGKRRIPETLDRTMFEEKACCLLCSEDTPEKCHRRIVAERLARHWNDVEVIHL